MVKQLQTKLMLLLCMLVAGVSSVWAETFIKVDAPTSGKSYVVVAGNYAITASGANSWVNGTDVSGSISGNTLTTSNTEIVWEMTASNNKWKFKNGTNYLQNTSGTTYRNMGVGSTQSEYTISNSKIYSTGSNATNKYLQYLPSGPGFRMYASNQDGASVTFTFYEKQDKTISSLVISGYPSKTEYTEGENFVPTGLVVTATYTDETTADVTSNATFTCTPSELTAATTSVSVVAQVNGISSAAYNVSVTVNEIIKYTVTIEPPTNGSLVIKKGNEIVASGTQIANGTELTAVPTPADGYKFRNWQAVDVSTHTYTANYTYTINGSDVTFKANFDPIPQYTYTWYVDEKVVKTETLYENADVEFPTVTAPSYTDKVFFGWVTTESVAPDETPTCVNTTDVKALANTSYYAVFATRTAGNVTETTDVLTRTTTGVTGTSYKSWSGKTITSDAVYAGQSAGGNESIQLRSDNSNSGVITTETGGRVSKIVVEWQSSTASGRTIDIYGSNAAYESPTELYNESTQGTLLGSLTKGSTTLKVSGEYAYIGIRSNNGALYLTSISITWEAGTPDTYSDFTTTFPKATISINAACNDGNGAYYGTFFTDLAYVMHEDLAGEIVSVDENGKMSIDAVYNGGDVVPANTGLLILALEPGDYQVNLTDETGVDWSEYNMLKGTLTADETTIGDDCLFYRLTMHEGTKIGFWWGAENGGSFTPGANKAYLAVPNSVQGARISGFSFDADNTTTAIENVSRKSATSDRCYNLNGQRVDASMKGIVIVNGKKVINK